jgi:hypothetical protein
MSGDSIGLRRKMNKEFQQFAKSLRFDTLPGFNCLEED